MTFEKLLEQATTPAQRRNIVALDNLLSEMPLPKVKKDSMTLVHAYVVRQHYRKKSVRAKKSKKSYLRLVANA